MSDDPRLWGTVEDANPRDQSHLTLDNYGPRSQIDPPLKYEVCIVCGFVYRRNRMVRYKKQWYCRPQECYRDIVGIELKNNEENYFKNRSIARRFYNGVIGRGL